jgi:hypothetical protein
MLPLYYSSNSGITRESNNKQDEVAINVLNQLNQIQRQFEPNEKPLQSKTAVEVVSVEQALKELRELGAI